MEAAKKTVKDQKKTVEEQKAKAESSAADWKRQCRDAEYHMIEGEKVEDRVSMLHINYGVVDLTSNHEIRENLRNYMRNTPAWAMFTIGTDVFKFDSMPGVRKTAVVAYRYDQTGRVRFWWGREGEKPQFDNWVKDPPAKRTD